MAEPAPRKRYITKDGFERLRERFRKLLNADRPRVTREVTVAAAHGDRSENYEYKLGKRKLREIDAQLHKLQKALEAYEVIDPATRPKSERAFFGATVTVEDEEGAQTTWQIVGSDELAAEFADPGGGKRRPRARISFEAPLGRALLGKRAGDEVQVSRPSGLLALTVVKVEWR